MILSDNKNTKKLTTWVSLFNVALRYILDFFNTKDTAQDTGKQTGLDNNDFHKKVSFRQFR